MNGLPFGVAAFATFFGYARPLEANVPLGINSALARRLGTTRKGYLRGARQPRPGDGRRLHEVDGIKGGFLPPGFGRGPP